jgi:hypothetical protein
MYRLGHSILGYLSGKGRRRQVGLTWLLLLLLCTCASAQKADVRPNELPDTAIYEYPVRTITVRDGLSRNQLYLVWEDKRGFAWLAGKRGLDRFDGLEVVSFQSDSTMRSDLVRNIIEDGSGDVYFFANDALYSYDGSRFQRRELPADIFPRYIINCDDVLHYSDWNEETRYIVRENFGLDTILSVKEVYKSSGFRRYPYLDSEGGLYVSTWSDGASPDTLSYFSLFDGATRKVLRVADTIVLLAKMNPAHPQRVLINDSLFFLRADVLSFERTIQLDIVLPGWLWDSPNGPIIRNDRLIYLGSSPFPQLLYASDFNYSIHQRHDHLYVASEEGLNILRPQSPVLLFPTERGMASDVWSTLAGADAGAKKGGGAKFFLPFTGGQIVKMKDGQYTSLSDDPALRNRFYPGATRREDGTFLLPTTYRLLQFDPATERLTSLDTVNRRATNDLLESGNRIYAATLGLAYYEDDRLVKIYGDEDGLDVTNLDFLESINEDRDGRLWLGSHKGLAVREPDGTFRNYLAGQQVPTGIVHGATDLRGNLWFATHDGIAFHDYTDTLPRWVTPDFHEDVKFVHVIDSTWLLIAGVSKLYLLDLPKFYAGEIDLYPLDEDDGFPVVEPLQASVMQDSEGIIWIGTTDGVVRLDPSKIKTYKEPTKPHFHSFSWLDESGEQEQTVVLPFNENGEQSFTVKSTDQNIDIRFFTINHDKPHAMRFRHRLVGYRGNWTKPSPNRTMNYGELPPGNYTFELQACLYGKCTASKSLGLRVAPARFWEYLLAKLLFGGGVLILFGTVGYQLYVRRRERFRSKRQAQAFELERADARRKLTVHKVGPHFANNALTAITDLIIRGENEAARRYTSHFAELFTPVLEDELSLLWTLSEELAFINDYLQLEELRFGEKLSYFVEIDPTLEEAADDILVPTLLVQSFVNNAVKHGVEPIKRGVLLITFTQPEQDYLRVTITDNGPGFASAQPEDEGTGIAASRVMVDYLNQYTETHSSISFYQPKADETTVTLRLYLHHQLID